MNKVKTIDRTMVVRAVISKIQDEESPKLIKAKDLKEFDNPNKIVIRGDKNGFIPDIEAVYDEKLHVYAIELNNRKQTDKWRLLSLYAKKKNGNFYLVVPDFAKDEIKQNMIDNKINAGLIYFETE